MYIIEVDYDIVFRNRFGVQIGREFEVELAVKPDGDGYVLVDLSDGYDTISDPSKFDATPHEKFLWHEVQRLVNEDYGLQALIHEAERELEFERGAAE